MCHTLTSSRLSTMKQHKRTQHVDVPRSAVIAVLLLPCCTSALLVGSNPALTQSPGATPPTSDLMQRVGKTLGDHHRALGGISQELLEVQSIVDHTERSMLGKILDVQSARNLYAQHMQVQEANAKARSELASLNAQVAGLSSQVHDAQKYLMETSQREHTSENLMNDEATKDRAELQSLEQELAKGKDSLATHEQLASSHNQLVAESQQIAKLGADVVAELQRVRNALKAEGSRQAKLKKSALDMHDYDVDCHKQAETLAKQDASVKQLEPKVHQAAVVTEKHAEASIAAAEQRLLAEGALVRTEVRRAETASANAYSTLQFEQRKMKVLQDNIIRQMREMTQKVAEEEQRDQSVEASVAANEAADNQDKAAKTAMERRIRKVESQLSPVRLSGLQAENEAIAVELRHAMELLDESKTAEARAQVAAQQAAAEAEAQTAAAESAGEALRLAHEEGQKEIKEAIDKAAASKTKAEATVQSAEDALKAHCRVRWEKRAQKRDKELADCNSKKEQLAVANAQRETLQQVMKSQQTT